MNTGPRVRVTVTSGVSPSITRWTVPRRACGEDLFLGSSTRPFAPSPPPFADQLGSVAIVVEDDRARGSSLDGATRSSACTRACRGPRTGPRTQPAQQDHHLSGRSNGATRSRSPGTRGRGHASSTSGPPLGYQRRSDFRELQRRERGAPDARSGVGANRRLGGTGSASGSVSHGRSLNASLNQRRTDRLAISWGACASRAGPATARPGRSAPPRPRDHGSCPSTGSIADGDADASSRSGRDACR